MGYQSVERLKGIARDKMLGNYGTAIGAFLFMRFLLMAGIMVSSVFAAGGGVLSLLISFIFSLIEGVLVYGELSIYLKISVGMRTGVMDVLSAFKGTADKAIKARLVLVLILYGSLIAGMFLEYIISRTVAADSIMTVALVMWLVVGCVCIYLLLTYSQILYFLQDFSDINVREACKRSQELMKGNKLSLLFIYLGFVPLYILGFLSLMIGTYFVHPYLKMTLTEFYLDRVRSTKSQSIDVSI